MDTEISSTVGLLLTELLWTSIYKFLCGHSLYFFGAYAYKWLDYGSYGKSIFNHLRDYRIVVQSIVYYFAFQASICEGSHFSISLKTLVFVWPFDFHHTRGLTRYIWLSKNLFLDYFLFLNVYLFTGRNELNQKDLNWKQKHAYQDSSFNQK